MPSKKRPFSWRPCGKVFGWQMSLLTFLDNIILSNSFLGVLESRIQVFSCN